MQYFVNTFDKIVSNVKSNADFTEITKETAYSLLEEHDNVYYNWIYFNETELKRYHERMGVHFDKNYFEYCLERCTVILTTNKNITKEFLQSVYVYDCYFKYDIHTNFLTIFKISIDL